MDKIKVAIVGVGNCASALIQGVHYYGGKKAASASGLMHWKLGGYAPGDIRVVAAFDIDRRQVGRDVSEITCSVNVRYEADLDDLVAQATAWQAAGADLAIVNLPHRAKPELLAPVAALEGPLPAPGAGTLLALAGLAVGSSAGGLTGYFALIRAAGASRASVVAYVAPAVAVALGIAFFREPFGLSTAAGFLLILLGSWAATRRDAASEVASLR